MSTPAVRVPLVNDYDVVLRGLAHMIDDYRDRIVIVEIDANTATHDRADVLLYDSFAQPEADDAHIADLVANPRVRHVAVYTWNFDPALIDDAMRLGAHGYLSKTLAASDLVAAIERIAVGEVVVSEEPRRATSAPGLDWPGKREGITDRESEILALVTQGLSNADVARVTHLSGNTVKSYVHSVYRKIGVTSRTQAVLYGVAHGFAPDVHRVDHWRGGP